MKHDLITIAICLGVSLSICAQNSTPSVMDYRRNALASMLVFHPEDEFGPNIHEAYLALPTPDKYDDHNLNARIIDNSLISGVRPNKSGFYKAEYGHVLSKQEENKNAAYLETMLNDAQVGKLLIAKWFNMTGETVDSIVFNTALLQERGQYNANDLDVEFALQTIRGVASLGDAGEELLNNTFVLVNDITYVTAEQEAQAAKTSMAILGGLLDAFTGGNAGRNLAAASAAIADSFTGFNVKTHSYLFQLIWNEEVAATFYKMHYTKKPDSAKVAAFLADQTTYKVRYVAHEYEYDKQSVLKGKYERSELVKTICARSIDKNIVALGKQYEDFKVKTPVYEVVKDEKDHIQGYAAKIGLKEGMTETSKYQVIQRVYNPETNKTTYKYIASIQPIKGQIWDNRYNAVLEQDAGSDLPYTLFKKTAGGEIRPGMLIVEGKYSKVTE